MKEIDKAQQLYAKSRAGKEVKKEIHPFSMWSFGLSIAPFLSIFFMMIPFLNIILLFLFVFVGPIVSIILGILSFSKIDNNSKKYFGKGYSIAGILISILVLVIVIIFAKLIISAWNNLI